MLKLSRFRKGGVHPRENKDFSNQAKIVNADLPKVVKIPLAQHLGAPAKCVVNPGDLVQEGDLIGEATGAFSANVHSSIKGTVKEIIKDKTPAGNESEMVVIELDGTFVGQVGVMPGAQNWEALDRQAILDRIRKAGIVGLGGATFPTHIKVSPPEDKKIDFLIANGVECEPYLTCDHRLMVEKGEEVLTGLKILMKMMDVPKAIIGIENNKPDAIEQLDKLCANESSIDILPLRVQYPQGAEKQLIEAAIGKEVPTGGLPMDVGCVVSNVGTLFSVYEAVIYDKPITDRVVTVTGSIVNKPGNYKTRIGTTIDNLLDECGLKETPKKVIIGGPMMGFAQEKLDIPVVKGTSGVLVLSEKEVRDSEEKPCIRCGACIRACPMSLMPCSMKELCNANQFDEVKKIGLFDCIECGCCSFECPSHIPLVQYFRLGKLMIKAEKKYVDYKVPTIPF